MLLKKNDLVQHETGIIATVLKTYKNEDGQEYIQVLTTDSQIVYGNKEQFELMDCMLLRCNNCENEAYEYELDAKEENQMYVCECGSSTFTPLNLDLEELGVY